MNAPSSGATGGGGPSGSSGSTDATTPSDRSGQPDSIVAAVQSHRGPPTDAPTEQAADATQNAAVEPFQQSQQTDQQASDTNESDPFGQNFAIDTPDLGAVSSLTGLFSSLGGLL